VKTFISENIKTPITDIYDVLVCGGGPAGVAAAVAAARMGVKTGLIEQNNCLGGTWTAGALTWILDHENKCGIMKEILELLEKNNARTFINNTTTNAFDIEIMKYLLESICCEVGVDIKFHTKTVGAVLKVNSIQHVLIESKSGREAIGAKMFIDCTGDGDLAYYSGCGYEYGNPVDGLAQPMSLIAILGGLNIEEIKDYYELGIDVPWHVPKDNLRIEMEKGGHSPSYAMPTLFWIRNDLFALMANHEYAVSGLNSKDLTKATIHARKEVNELVNGLRSLGGKWENIYIVSTASHIGVREGRRIHGLYTVTKDDIINGIRHKDAVCRVNFGIDIHSTNPSHGKAIEKYDMKSKPYDIPLRALISKDIDNLLMAGRCISGDFIAHSSYRVTGNAVAMGEAAGKKAAIDSNVAKFVNY